MARPAIRIDLGPDHRVGPGRVQRLEMIAEHGAISAAGRALGMSYLRAWRLVEATNKGFGKPVFDAQIGGGARLLPFGADIVAQCRAIERVADTSALPFRAKFQAPSPDDRKDCARRTGSGRRRFLSPILAARRPRRGAATSAQTRSGIRVGRRLYPDGGIPDRLSLLPGLVGRSDPVLISVAGVSHRAVNTVERCRETAGQSQRPIRVATVAARDEPRPLPHPVYLPLAKKSDHALSSRPWGWSRPKSGMGTIGRHVVEA